MSSVSSSGVSDSHLFSLPPLQECPENGVSFRAVQCAQHGQQPYKGENRTWLPVLFDRKYSHTEFSIPYI